MPVFMFQLMHVEQKWLKPGTLLKESLVHGCFSRFLNCVDRAKYHIF